jgi:hypothetical protein
MVWPVSIDCTPGVVSDSGNSFAQGSPPFLSPGTGDTELIASGLASELSHTFSQFKGRTRDGRWPGSLQV